MKVTKENRAYALSARAKLRKALNVPHVEWTKTDRAAVERIIGKLDALIRPAKPAKAAKAKGTKRKAAKSTETLKKAA